MSGEYDDLLAAFNISSADGQKQKTATTDDKPSLTSPKKLALNEKASTTDLPDVDSDDDDGWIIDETAPGESRESSSAPAAPDKLQNGGAEKNRGSHQKTPEVETQNRRKQVLPRTAPQLSPPGTIAASYTPIQGWKGATTNTNAPPTNPWGPPGSGHLKKYIMNTMKSAINTMPKQPISSSLPPQYPMNPPVVNTAPNMSSGVSPAAPPQVPQATVGAVIPPIGTFTQAYRSRSRSPGASVQAVGTRMLSPGLQLHPPGAVFNVPRSSLPLPVNTPGAPNNIVSVGRSISGPTIVGGFPPTPKSPGASLEVPPKNNRVAERMVIPVIDQTSVVSKGQAAKPIAAKEPTPASPVRWTLSSQSTWKLLDPKQRVPKVYRPSVACSKYKDYGAPEGGFQCKACSSTFLSESSILAHVKRPSFVMAFPCESCPGRSVHRFYNRCALWLHLYSHSLDATKQLEKLVKTVEIEPFTRAEFLKYDFGANCTKVLSNFFTKSGWTSCENTVAGVGPKCLACQGSLKDGESMVDHLGRFDKQSMGACPTCRRLLRNDCERQLHRLMHKKRSVCPGCGTRHASEKGYFDHGSRGTCLYWLSAPLFVCSLCLQPHYSLLEFGRHLCDHHNISYFKCILCQLAFRGANTLYDHHRKEHRFTPIPRGVTNLQKILKCPLCKNVFTGSTALQSHIADTHQADMVSRVHKYVYRCPRCPETSRNFYDQSGLANHVRHAHGMPKTPVLCDLCGMHLFTVGALHAHRHGCHKFVKRRKEDKHEEGTAGGKVAVETKRVLRCSQCPPASRVFYSTEMSFNTHCRTSHPGSTPYPVWVELVTTKNNKTTTTVVSPQNSSKKDSKKPKSPKLRRIEPASTVLSKTTASAGSAAAPTYTASANAGGDASVPTPGDTTIGQPTMTDSKKDGSASSNQTNKRPSSEELEQAKKRVKTGDSTARVATPVRVPQKVERDIRKRRRQCAKCEFASEEWADFQEHIKTHRTNPSHQQCQECGVCFRSSTAVARHMAMSHSIQTPVGPAAMPLSTPAAAKSAVTARRKEPSPPPKVVTPLPAATTPRIKAEPPTMECTVCYRKFTTDTLLRNHMRTHGMAFIRSKRSSRDYP